MLDDVTVPDVQTADVELRRDPGDLPRVGDHRVLESRFPRLRGTSYHARRSGDSATARHRETYQMQVDRVGVLGEVVDNPFLDVLIRLCNWLFN